MTEPVRLRCPRCGVRFRARVPPSAKGVRCPAKTCDGLVVFGDSDPVEGAAFAWSAVAAETPGPRPKAESKPGVPLLALAGVALGGFVLLVAIGSVVGIVVSRRPAAQVEARQPEPKPPESKPPPEDPKPPRLPKPDLKPTLTVEIVRAEPDRPSAGDDLEVTMRGGRPGAAVEYRIDGGTWQPAEGGRVRLRAVPVGRLTFEARAIDGGEASAVAERIWSVLPSARPTIEIAGVSPEKPRPGGSVRVRLKGKRHDGGRVAFQFRTTRDGEWADVVGDFVTLADLKEGPLRLEVRSRGDGGSTSEPLAREWTVPSVQVTKEPARKYAGHKTCAHGVAFVPGGSKFLSGSCDRTLTLWDSSNQDFVAPFAGTLGAVFALDVSPDGKLAAVGFSDIVNNSGVQVWDVEAKKAVRKMTGQGSVTCVKFSPDGRTLASGGGDSVRLWEVASGKEVRKLRADKTSVMAVAFSPDGKRVVAGGAEGKAGAIVQWSVESGEILGRMKPPHRVTGFAFSGAADRLLSCSGRVYRSESSPVDSHVRAWDVGSGKEAGSFLGNKDGVTSLALTSDGKYVFCASGDATMQLREVEGGGEVHRFVGHKKKVLCLGISRDSRYVVTGSEDGQLLLWDLPREVHIVEERR